MVATAVPDNDRSSRGIGVPRPGPKAAGELSSASQPRGPTAPMSSRAQSGSKRAVKWRSTRGASTIR